MTSKYVVEVIPITAVHIGTGNEFSPLDYVIKQNLNEKDVYMRFNSEKVIAKLEEKVKEKLLKYIDEDKISEINELFKEHVTEDNSNYTSTVTPEIFNKYSSKLENVENQLLIAEMYRNSSNFHPIIPGSSLKGAIRTAIVSEIAKKKNTIRDKKYPEKEILEYDNAKNDPFRTLYISDCEINGNNIEKIADFVNFKEKRKNSDDFSKMQMIKEHITGQLLNGDAKGECDITFQDDIHTIKQQLNEWKPFKIKLDLKGVINSCNSFYFKNLEDEYNNFYKNSSYPILKENGKRLIELIEKLIDKEKNECLVRIGQFSQIENVTLEKHREPWNIKGYGKTRTLTECNFPVGWVKLKFLSIEEAKELKKHKEAEKKQEELKEREEQEIIDKKRMEIEEKERIEKERVASLTPEELLKEEITKEIQSRDGQRISAIVKKCLAESTSKDVFRFLKEQLIKIDEWKAKGGNQKKKRMKKRIEDIETMIGG